MPRPADILRAQLAAEDADFVAALLADQVQVARLGPHGRGFRYRKGPKVVEVFGPEIIALPDGTEVDTDLVDGVTEDVAVTPFDARFARNGGYGMRVGGVTLRFGGPEYRVSPGVWEPVILTGRTRVENRVTWDNQWGGTYGMRVTSSGIDTRWTFAVPPVPIRVLLTVGGSVPSSDGVIPLADGESLTIQGARWRDSTVDGNGDPAQQSGVIPFATQGGYIPLVLPAGLTFPVTVDG